ncbi:histone-like nucleoid-structuring protein Lsr2 [Corynebacterium halotolerans]|uniref:histone-like nucleoid-structuring protein Lsr2 n=1 Tax=Corynebacterium halotolerans TaxID=225326 RepID=UPI003CF6039F
MARREVTQYFDDLDSTPLGEEDLHIVRFGFEGTDYILDLSEQNAQKFQQLMEPYVKAARKMSTPKAPRRESVSTRGNSRAIRQWAQEQGMKIANRGKIPHEIIDAYHKAHA